MYEQLKNIMNYDVQMGKMKRNDVTPTLVLWWCTTNESIAVAFALHVAGTGTGMMRGCRAPNIRKIEQSNSIEGYFSASLANVNSLTHFECGWWWCNIIY